MLPMASWGRSGAAALHAGRYPDPGSERGTRGREETKVPGPGSQLDAGQVLGPWLWLREEGLWASDNVTSSGMRSLMTLGTAATTLS